MKILIVDDEAPIREYISYCIREAGPEFELAGCFARADKVLEYLRDGEAELLLCDITMPGMDGLEPVSYTHLGVYKRQRSGRWGH